MRRDRKELQKLLTAAFGEYLEQLPDNALYDRIAYALKGEGKRIRPALVLMGSQLFSDNPQAALPAALAVEIFHNFTLVHDDIMDKAPLRRGRSTVHARWDTNGAILSGDAMLIEAYSLLNRLDTPEKGAVVDTFNKAALEVCLGQQLDMDYEAKKRVSVAEYLEMIRLKTAVLLGCSLKIGARIAGASAADGEELYHFGQAAGIAFQLQDDLLDAFGDPETFGKQVGGDILSNKKTFLFIRALEKANPKQRKELQTLYSEPSGKPAPEEKVKKVMAIFRDLEIDKDTESLSDKYFAKALLHLGAVKAGPFSKQPLRDFVDTLKQREK